MEHLGYLNSLLGEINSTNIVIVGDFNANLGLTGTKLFKNHLLEFCDENRLMISSRLLLPSNSYSYVCTREGIQYYSWLDHVLSSSDFHKCIDSISMAYDMSDDDHIPVILNLKVECLPDLAELPNNYSEKINWDTVDEYGIKKYLSNTDRLLSNIKIPVDALYCGDLRCKHTSHRDRIIHFLMR